ncbi:triphosphoribosyl-dephospho-CoA synthase, partial [Pseudomonas toyotomiensis]
DLERDMLRLRASPGGAADLLAATLFLDRLQHGLPAQLGSL